MIMVNIITNIIIMTMASIITIIITDHGEQKEESWPTAKMNSW